MLKRLFAEISGRLRRARAQSDRRHAANPISHPDGSDPGESAFTAVLARQDNAISCNELGERRLADGARADARACFERAVALDPRLVAARFNLGNLLFGANLIDEAAAQYTAIVALQPDNPDASNNLGMTFLQSGRPADAVRTFRNVLKMHPEFDQARNNLLLALTLAPGHTPQEMLEEHLRHANGMRHARATNKSGHPNLPDPRRRLRIGYVSGDFKNHPVAWFMVRILAQHDANRFEIFCYSNWYKADAMTKTINGHADAWRQIDDLTDDSVAALVREDRIDILIDLSGHTNGGRLGVFALKPAPVQMTYLGYLNTTGLAAIDYRITDAYCDPPGKSDGYYVEKLLRLPNCMWCYNPHEEMPELGALPAIANGHITFGSFNNAMKINSELMALWSRVLRAVPDAKLIIAGLPEGLTRERIRAEFVSRGIAAPRVELLGRLPMQEFWRLHHRVDIALDSFPYNGGTTTCDTLWMGVPVVTQCGDRIASRGGYSILANVGLADLAAHDDDEYVAVAASLANDLIRLETMHAGLRERLRASPLLDVALFTDHLESAYRKAWETWCLSRHPQTPVQITASNPCQPGKSI